MASVTIPFSYLENYAQTVHDLDAINQSLLADALAATDLNDKRAVASVMRAVCQTSNEQAQELATAFYRGLSLMQTGKDMTKRVKSGWDETATDVAVSAILRDTEGDPEGMASQLSQRLSFEINRASKRGVYRAGQADGRQVRYARVPVGAETCAWCIMTAGLGFWYMTEESASHSHGGCDCVIVSEIVERPKTGEYRDVRIEGYDSSTYREMYQRANALRANGDLPQGMFDHIADIRSLREMQGRPYRDDTNGTLYVMRQMYGLK